jgi:hypothetical protein
MIYKMHTIQFVSNVNLIQIRLMKVIYNMKNILIQEFQYYVESQLSMISENFESIFDLEYQGEIYFQQ